LFIYLLAHLFTFLFTFLDTYLRGTYLLTYILFITSPPRDVQTIMTSMLFCLSICLRISLRSHNSKTTQPIFVHVDYGPDLSGPSVAAL